MPTTVDLANADEQTSLPPPIAFFLARFPVITEVFALREINEMERQGQPVRLVSLLRENPRVVHAEAKPWMDRALFSPYISWPIIAANFQRFFRHPVRYLHILATIILESLPSPPFLIRSLAIFPKSIYIGDRLEHEGIRHMHARFATHSATAAMIASAVTGIPFSFTAEAHDIFVDRALLGAKIRRAAFVRTISKFNACFLQKHYPHVAEKLRIIHVGINAARYEVPRRTGGDRPLILCNASFKPYKGLPVLVEACARLAAEGVPFRCEVIGDGPMRPKLEELIRAHRLSERIVLVGNLPQHDIPAHLVRADVFVLPSVVAPDGQMEGIPVSLMEAMASELPVVSTTISGIPELVHDGKNGSLVPPNDAAGLAAAIRTLLADPERRSLMGRAGRETVCREFVLSETVRDLAQNFNRPVVQAPKREVAAPLARRVE